jgi:hypothetical protein
MRCNHCIVGYVCTQTQKNNSISVNGPFRYTCSFRKPMSTENGTLVGSTYVFPNGRDVNLLHTQVASFVSFVSSKCNEGWCSSHVLGLYSEVLGSNLDRNTGYPDLDFSWVTSVNPCKCRDNTMIKTQPLPSKSFPIH